LSNKKRINIVVSRPVRLNWPTDCLQEITAVSSRIKLNDISELIEAEAKGDIAATAQIDSILKEAEILYGNISPKTFMSRAPKLKWIQTPLAGVDFFLKPEIINSPVILTNARIHGTQIRELVFNLMLMLARQSYQHFRYQQQKKWQPIMPSLLEKKTIGILGMGNIGQAVAKLSKAFGMRVVAMRARAAIPNKYVDITYPPTGLREILAQADYLVIILPLTPETRNLIGETELRAMKPTAYLINVARGGIVDEAALIRALRENWIAGAGLDVFATEPLPADSELWDLPNIIISPHNAGTRPDYYELATKQFCKNLKLYLSGKELINVVDKQKGY
jgi:phosphoglycerate dehydrogenase-like enzyme